jgi:tetratricopeptide (TPR) repeat protein
MARRERVLLSGISAALAAYVVQAAFDIQQIALSFSFWTLLALLCVLAAPDGSPRGGVRVRSRAWLVGAVATAALVAALPQLTRPLRADRSYRDALLAEAAAGQSTAAGLRVQRLAAAAERIDAAVALHPWESRYLSAAARIRTSQALAAPHLAADRLRRARALLRRATELRPRDAALLDEYGTALLRVHKVDPADPTALPQALRALDRATKANPWEPGPAIRLSAVLARSGRRERALTVLERALAYAPRNRELLRAAARVVDAGAPVASG